ncbi:adenosylmethionine--8-amino-7-oxononanoate transaminase [Streptomyces aidingensis]|uniref:Adenosylmethionine-8-amino-7-oxononanoate aminotransferase n=1 Tax=Streptomyces aidingensis TaxID=910347 RepID=A0A1I1MWA9_9ACTN|nr:adenosylmethionine--8-amino-7-oxononanoate transaminase [Streptomyces aidingensis]SFC89724.1 adenosylmethionine-8-amino-7-oxononanoate aminotransferase [Streptomyces aidingensis]
MTDFAQDSADDTAPLTGPQIAELDRRHLWHPYAPHPDPAGALPVAGAAGTRIRLADGRELVDGMSSWWAAVHGYNHPVLNRAARRQLDAMSHVMFGGLTHEPAVRLARRLAGMAPGDLSHVFLSDSGSVSVEVAVKMALQYWHSRGRPAKHRLLTWRGGYHGDTWQAMSLSDPDNSMHHLWAPLLPRHVFAGLPPAGFAAPVDRAYAEHLERTVAEHAGELAAVIVEPVVQGAGGMRFHQPAYLRILRELCDRHGVLLVFDEIATGFGRTGRMFAAEHAGVVPDIMCVGKALTGGYLTLAATLCTPRVAEGIASGEYPQLNHGPTYMANPLACAVAEASLGLLTDGDWAGRVAAIETALAGALAPTAKLPGVREVRTLGAIAVVEMDRPVDTARAARAARAEGVWLRPYREMIYAMPPYVSSPEDLAMIARALHAAAEAAGQH